MKSFKAKIMFVVFLSFFVCHFTTVMAAQKVTTDLIKSSILTKGAKWKAGKTSISQLPVENRKALLKLKLRDSEKYMPGAIKKKLHTKLTAPDPPAALDWRNKDGVDWTTSIRNQGGCGSCWAFGSLAVLESLIEIDADDSLLNLNLSEQFFVSCSGGSCGGWYLDSTAEFLKTDGVPDETCFAYQAQNLSCGSKCANWEDSIRKITDWGWVGGYYGTATVAELKAALQNGPLFTLMAVYTDFYYYYSGIYEHVSGGLEGYHAVAIVGYDETNQYWICKNSWGSGWGDSGYFNIKMGTDEVMIETGSIWFTVPTSSDPDPVDPEEEESTGSLYITDTRSIAGTSVSIPVNIQNAPNNVTAFGFEVNIAVPAMLNYTGFEWGSLIGSFDNFNCSEPSDGVIRCGGFTANGGVVSGDSGSVVTLQFDVDLNCGAEYQLSLQNLADDMTGWTTADGTFDCSSCPCDVNEDGDVLPGDGLCVLQKYLGICPTDCGPCDEICADVNQDDAEIPSDSLEIHKKYEGMDSVCPDKVGPT